MIEVEMTRDIREYEPRILGFFTTRKLIWTLIGGVIVMLLVTTVPTSVDGKLILGFVGFLPSIIFGWTKGGEITMETYIKLAISQVIHPNTRLNKPINNYRYMEEPITKRKKTRKSKSYPRYR